MDSTPLFDPAGLEHLEYEALLPLYELALKGDPSDLEAMAWLGHAYTRLGRARDGLRMDLRLTEQLPADATVRYNLACSYALLDMADDAFRALEEAVGLGYDDSEHMSSDEDLAFIRDDPRFAELLRRLRSG